MARIYDFFPLQCPQCGGPVRIIAFITDAPSIRAILNHLGEPTAPPTRYANGGPEGHIAHQVFGEGPRDIVFVPDHPTNASRRRAGPRHDPVHRHCRLHGARE
jgi:hypothetical protein